MMNVFRYNRQLGFFMMLDGPENNALSNGLMVLNSKELDQRKSVASCISCIFVVVIFSIPIECIKFKERHALLSMLCTILNTPGLNLFLPSFQDFPP